MHTISGAASVMEMGSESGAIGAAGQTLTEMIAVAWMELAMFAIAAVFYGLFTGKLPGLSTAAKIKKVDETASALSEEDRVVRDLQRRLGENDHHSAFKLWQHVKSFDTAPAFDLAGVVRSMRALGKTDDDVLGELRSALDCNASIAGGLIDLLEALRGHGAMQLLDGVAKLLEARHMDVDARTYDALMTWHSKRGHFGQVSALGERCQVSITPKMRLMLAAATLRQSRLSDALEHVSLLPRKTAATTPSVSSPPSSGSTLPQTMAARLVSLAAREQRLADAIQLLKELDVCLETQTLDDLLQEAARRQDTQMRQQLYDLAGRVEPAEQPCEEAPEDLAKQVTMIKACGQERNLQGAVRVFDRLKQMGFADVVSYNTVLKAHLALGRFAAAQTMLRE